MPQRGNVNGDKTANEELAGDFRRAACGTVKMVLEVGELFHEHALP